MKLYSIFILLFMIGTVIAYTAPDFDSVNLVLSTDYTAQTYDSIDLVLGEVAVEEVSVTINSPENITYNISTILFNVTATSDFGIDTCAYSLDGASNIIMEEIGVSNIKSENYTGTLPGERKSSVEGAWQRITIGRYGINETFNLDNISWNIHKVAGENGTAKAYIFEGNYPNGTQLGSSTLDFADIGTSIAYHNFTFSDVSLQAGQNYSIAVNYTLDENSGIWFRYNISSINNIGGRFTSEDSFVELTWDYNWILYGNNQTGNWIDINSSMTEGQHNVTFACNDTESNINQTDYVYFTVDTVLDTCTYTSGNWDVDCSDNCSIDSNVNLGGNNLIFTNSGIFYLDADITNIDKRFLINGCEIQQTINSRFVYS